MKKNRRTKGPEQGASEGGKLVALPRQLWASLQELVVGAGLQALGAMLEREREGVCGPRYRHDAEREAYRAGHAPGELVMGGRRVSVKRPRARTKGGQEVALPSWERFSKEDPLEQRAVEQMLVGVATRKYARSLEEVPGEVSTRGTSKSAVSRRFVTATKARLDGWMKRDLSQFELTVLMVDGVVFAGHVVLVALGIDARGAKQVLGIWEGATENAATCRALLANLSDRGLRTPHSVLVVIDGAKALLKAVRAVFGERALVQRCQVHKKRNVLDQLPEHMRASVKTAMSEAYGTRDAARAKTMLTNLARRLETNHPGAASSLREGLDETLTVTKLELPEALARTLSSTNAIENLMGTGRWVARNVKRWRGGTMILRWMAAGMLEASRGFRRLRGYAGMPKVVAALRANDDRLEGAIDPKGEAA